MLLKTAIVKVDSTPIKQVFALRNVEQMKSITLLLRTANVLKVWVKLMELVKFVQLDQLQHQMDLHAQAVEKTPYKSMDNASVRKDMPITRLKFVLLALNSPMLS